MLRSFRNAAKFATPAGALMAVVACSDAPTSPHRATQSADNAPTVAKISCVATTRARSLSCSDVGGAMFGSVGNAALGADLVLGGQNVNVRLAATNVAYVADVFSFDATVTNLIGQKLGTLDGTTPSSSGIKVFFSAQPNATAGWGSVDFIDPVDANWMTDGVGAWTASNQPYYEYNEMLATGQTSSPKQWRIHVDPTVGSFVFVVYVSAPVQYPNGWIDVTPATTRLNVGTSLALAPVVRDPLGHVAGGQAITWSSSNPSAVSVNSLGVLTALRDVGIPTVITATSGPRAGSAKVCVSSGQGANNLPCG